MTIPVKLYSAVREHEIHFHYVRSTSASSSTRVRASRYKLDQGRIRKERVCSVCGKPVDWKDIVRGHEYEKGQYVLLDEDDFKKASPEASQSVDIVEFVQ